MPSCAHRLLVCVAPLSLVTSCVHSSVARYAPPQGHSSEPLPHSSSSPPMLDAQDLFTHADLQAALCRESSVIRKAPTAKSCCVAAHAPDCAAAAVCMQRMLQERMPGGCVVVACLHRITIMQVASTSSDTWAAPHPSQRQQHQQVLAEAPKGSSRHPGPWWCWDCHCCTPCERHRVLLGTSSAYTEAVGLLGQCQVPACVTAAGCHPPRGRRPGPTAALQG